MCYEVASLSRRRTGLELEEMLLEMPRRASLDFQSRIACDLEVPPRARGMGLLPLETSAFAPLRSCAVAQRCVSYPKDAPLQSLRSSAEAQRGVSYP